jgi:F-type H+-transporting ATPase subunit c
LQFRTIINGEGEVMRKFVSGFIGLIGTMLVGSTAWAQEAAAAATSSQGLVAIGSGLVLGLCALGGTLAQGKAAGSALEGIARNPGSKDQVFTPMILALALIEFQAIMGFIIAILWWTK